MDKAYNGIGSWDADTTVCAACAAEEQYRKDNPDPEPGLKVYAVDAAAAADAPGEVKPEFD